MRILLHYENACDPRMLVSNENSDSRIETSQPTTLWADQSQNQWQGVSRMYFISLISYAYVSRLRRKLIMMHLISVISLILKWEFLKVKHYIHTSSKKLNTFKLVSVAQFSQWLSCKNVLVTNFHCKTLSSDELVCLSQWPRQLAKFSSRM